MASKSTLKFSTICLIILLIILFGIVFHQHKETKTYQNQVYSEKMTTKYYQGKTKQYTLNKLKHTYDKSEPNLYEVTKNNRNNITKGLTLAFSNCKTTKEFNHNKNKIMQLLGNNMGSKILYLVKPHLSESSTTSKPQSISSSLVRCRVSYGRFNNADATIPVNIVFAYRTTPYNNNRTTNKPHMVSRTYPITINANLFTQNNYMQVTQQFNQGQQMD